MPPKDALKIAEVPGPRWDLALDVIERAEGIVVIEGPGAVGLVRHSRWPSADEKIHVALYTRRQRSELTEAIASNEVRKGLDVLQRLTSSDGRLADLLNRYGVEFEYVSDYDNGAVRLAGVLPDGTIEWPDDLRPPR